MEMLQRRFAPAVAFLGLTGIGAVAVDPYSSRSHVLQLATGRLTGEQGPCHFPRRLNSHIAAIFNFLHHYFYTIRMSYSLFRATHNCCCSKAAFALGM